MRNGVVIDAGTNQTVYKVSVKVANVKCLFAAVGTGALSVCISDDPEIIFSGIDVIAIADVARTVMRAVPVKPQKKQAYKKPKAHIQI